MSTIYLLNYENYYNRKCALPQTNVINYEDYILAEFDNINFNPNDGINTELIVNYTGKTPNYLLVVDSYPIVDSRWYVLEAQRTRSGQLRLVLRKDLVADYYDYILDAPAMIERGRLSAYDPYIFNDEGMAFNQIKQSETLLKDESEIPWVVGYMATPQPNEQDQQVTFSKQISYDYSGDSDTTWQYGMYVKGNAVKTTEGAIYTHQIWAQETASISSLTYWFKFGEDTNYKLQQKPISTGSSPALKFPSQSIEYFNTLQQAFVDNLTNLNTAASNLIGANNALVSTLKNLEGKVVKIGANTFKTIRVKEQNVDISAYAQSGDGYFEAMSAFCQLPYDTGRQLFTGTPNSSSFLLNITTKQYYLELIPIDLSITIPIPATRNILSDAPYSMFAIPYGSLKYAVGQNIYNIGSEDTAIKAAAAISEQLGTKVYDIQLLPYCPFRRAIVGPNQVNVVPLLENIEFNYIYDEDETIISYIFWPSESNFTFDISTLITTPYDSKTTNQCITNRLCSPNYSSIYEFNIAKNGGIGGFNIDCAYKPFSPYIHVWPKGGIHSIYGNDFNDPRGLICSGDFSMPRSTDAWVQYELNNKNYQNMFNRQIETMDLTHKIQKTEQIVGAAVGTVSGTVSGVAAGAMIGGGYGAIAGGIIGGGASAVGGITDIIHGQQLRENERSQAFDMFRMGNENIQAMPDTLTKVSAFTPNNKIFPIYETYSATDIEITAFQDYIKYRGMRVGRIDNISNFIWPSWEFVQASIIRFDDLAEDSHVAYEINNELMKGVYLKQ